LGSPLVAGAASGPLRGESVAVKDLFEVAGFAVGAGNPAYLAESRPAATTAPAAASLLAAGADVLGIAQTDEFAYSIAGRNSHYGAPVNIASPGSIPGGSSSGPASAVASGQASIGLGTDTAGSIRVPASYQGLWGLRATHGAIDTSGLLPLAPSFDAVGWLIRSPGVLVRAAAASLDDSRQVHIPAEVAIAPATQAEISPGVRDAFSTSVERLVEARRFPPPDRVQLPDLTEAAALFRTMQAAEAWQVHGDWVLRHPGCLGPEIAARFAYAASVTTDQHRGAIAGLERIRASLDAALAGRALLLPSTATTAPRLDADAELIDNVRTCTLRLTCLAGIGGYPALSVPALRVDGIPAGLCLLGPRFSDLALIKSGQRIADALQMPAA
jgi:Asp-tRNA(Asn)/Glu-tRNA(Gln) amidotransferase A subunit family amidase